MDDPPDANLACADVGFTGVLHGVSLDVARGRCTALVGPSGAGKSTLLWILARLWSPTSGRVVHDGSRLGMVFQDLGLWDHLTVEQHLQIVGAAPQLRERMLERTRLILLRRRRPPELSGGERQRLALARALAIDPAWLLLDEPMAHLDGPARGELFELLRETIVSISAGVLLATHHAEEAMSLADDLAVLIDGRIVQRGAPQTVYGAPVSLAAARVLGPADMFRGRIVRPENTMFETDPDGGCRVVSCTFTGAAYLLLVKDDHETVTCRSDVAVTPGTRGSVACRKG